MQDKIRELRLRHGLTQTELADKLFISQHALSQYENSKREVTLSFFEKLLDVLNVEMFLRDKINNEGENLSMKKTTIFDFFETMKEKFPGWEVENTGGHIYVVKKDYFSEKLNKSILVSISDECAVIYRELTPSNNRSTKMKYINKETYDKSNDYLEYAYESEDLLYHIENGEYVNKDIALTIFNETDISDFKKISEVLGSSL